MAQETDKTDFLSQQYTPQILVTAVQITIEKYSSLPPIKQKRGGALFSPPLNKVKLMPDKR